MFLRPTKAALLFWFVLLLFNGAAVDCEPNPWLTVLEHPRERVIRTNAGLGHYKAESWISLMEEGRDALYTNEPRRATKFFLQALSLINKTNAGALTDPRVTATWRYLGDANFDTANYAGATEYYLREENVLNKISPTFPDLAYVEFQLGRIALNGGQFKISIERFKKALNVRERHPGPHNPGTNEIIVNLAVGYCMNKDLSSAKETIWRQTSDYRTLPADFYHNSAIIVPLAEQFHCPKTHPIWLLQDEIARKLLEVCAKQHKSAQYQPDIAYSIWNNHVHSGRLEQADKEANEAIELYMHLPVSPSTISRLAAMLQQTHDPKICTKTRVRYTIESARKLKDSQFVEQESFNLAAVEGQIKRLCDHEKSLETGLPDDPGELFQLGFSDYSQGRYDDAEALVKMACASFQRDQNVDHVKQCLVTLSMCYLLNNKLPKSRKAASRALDISKSRNDLNVQSYVVLAVACADSGDRPGAEASLLRARRLRQSDPSLKSSYDWIVTLCIIPWLKRHHDESKAQYVERLLQLQGVSATASDNQTDPLYLAAQSLLEQKKCQEAAAAFRRFLDSKRGPDSLRFSAITQLISLYSQADHSKSNSMDDVAVLRKRLFAEFDQPKFNTKLEFADACSNLGATYYDNGCYGESEPLLTTALSKYANVSPSAPQYVSALIRLGACLQQKERFAEAKLLFEKALGLTEKHTEHPFDNWRFLCLYHLGVLGLELGRPESEIMANFNQVQVMCKQDKTLRERLPYHVKDCTRVLQRKHLKQRADQLLSSALAVR